MHYTTPLIQNRADPWLYRHTDGRYYFTATSPGYDCIELRVATSIEGLRTAEKRTIWRKHNSGSMSQLVWAPEIHFVMGKWYVYFAAAPTKAMHPLHGTFQHRIFALEADDPGGTWRERGQIQTGLDTFCLDATVFCLGEEWYFVWAQKDPEITGNSNLYISRMENAFTLCGPQVMLTKPEYPWECSVIPVNEGPAVLLHGDTVCLTYSANATGAEYCMGMLTMKKGDDPLDAQAWTKAAKPVFETSLANRRFGPGHNGFTFAEDGKTPVLVYHVRDHGEIEGDPLDNPDRHTCVQVFSFDKYGLPAFGTPVPRNV